MSRRDDLPQLAALGRALDLGPPLTDVLELGTCPIGTAVLDLRDRAVVLVAFDGHETGRAGLSGVTLAPDALLRVTCEAARLDLPGLVLLLTRLLARAAPQVVQARARAMTSLPGPGGAP